MKRGAVVLLVAVLATVLAACSSPTAARTGPDESGPAPSTTGTAPLPPTTTSTSTPGTGSATTTVIVPSLEGLSLADASDAAGQVSGLTYRIVRARSAVAPAGIVDKQSPAAGAVVPAGTRVTITVSSGPSST